MPTCKLCLTLKVSLYEWIIMDKGAYCEKEACSDDLLVRGSTGLLSAEEKPTQTA